VREVGSCQKLRGKAVQLAEAVGLEARDMVLLEERLLGLV